jgi:TPR repeat protein
MFKINFRSADNGDPVAQLEVGKAYLSGVGVEQDAAQARNWLEQALRQGVQAAKAHLEQLPGA